jgi:hypothetical protein
VAWSEWLLVCNNAALKRRFDYEGKYLDTFNSSLGSYHRCDPDLRVYLQPVRQASAVCAANSVCLFSAHGADGIVDVEGAYCSTIYRMAKCGIGEKSMKATTSPNDATASAKITERIEELGDWRGKTLAHLRQLIHDADPEIEEEWKFMGTPVFSHDGIVCTGESYKQVVKCTFARGASLKDPKKLFNSSLEGNVRRAIDIREGEKINEAAFRQLIRAAVAENAGVLAERAAKKK